MDEKQKRMYEWLMHRIIFAMDQGGLTELQCLSAVNDADTRLTEIKEAKL